MPFVHLRYSCTYGVTGRLPMKMFLATAGSDKVDITVLGGPNESKSIFISIVRAPSRLR